MRDHIGRGATGKACALFRVVRATRADAVRHRDRLLHELQGPTDVSLCTPTETCFGSELCIYDLPRMNVENFVSSTRRLYLCYASNTHEAHDAAPLGCLVVSEFADVMQMQHVLPYRFTYEGIPTCRRVYLISSVCVAKALRGLRGVGRSMMEHVLRDLHRSDPNAEVMLTVRPRRALEELPCDRRDAQHELNRRFDGLVRFYRARGFDVVDRDATMWLMRRVTPSTPPPGTASVPMR